MQKSLGQSHGKVMVLSWRRATAIDGLTLGRAAADRDEQGIVL
jgi:hypothetical protein